MATHYILFYDYVEDIVDRRDPYREAHLERIRSARDSGRVVMAGALGDPPHGGALVFADIDPGQIEEFAREDPYVEAGLVRDWRIERWNVV